MSSLRVVHERRDHTDLLLVALGQVARAAARGRARDARRARSTTRSSTPPRRRPRYARKSSAVLRGGGFSSPGRYPIRRRTSTLWSCVSIPRRGLRRVSVGSSPAAAGSSSSSRRRSGRGSRTPRPPRPEGRDPRFRVCRRRTWSVRQSRVPSCSPSTRRHPDTRAGPTVNASTTSWRPHDDPIVEELSSPSRQEPASNHPRVESPCPLGVSTDASASQTQEASGNRGGVP